jgi:hypothetical protein
LTALELSKLVDDDPTERDIFLEVDQELGESAGPRPLVIRTEPSCAFGVREQQDAEELGAETGSERVEAGTQLLLDREAAAIRLHDPSLEGSIPVR